MTERKTQPKAADQTEQEQLAKARAEADKFQANEVEGGVYIVNDKKVDANGKPVKG